MSETTTSQQGSRSVTLTFDRELRQDEIEQLRQKTDALHAAMAPAAAAHHHDVTRLE